MKCFPRYINKELVLAGISAVILFSSLPAAAAAPQPLPVPDNLPPCSIERLPEQAPIEFPCGAILFSDNDVAGVAEVGAKAGAMVRFAYRAVNGAALVIRDRETLRSLAENPVLQLIPDRMIYAPPASKGKDKTGGSGGQVTPSGVARIGAAPGLLPVSGYGVGVAVVDTGIDLANGDLSPGEVCFDAFNGDCIDRAGHGTHVSGIIAALDNDIDVVGVAPLATPYAVKVLDDSGSGSDATILAGLDWIATNAQLVAVPIKVVNMSLGRSGTIDDNPVLHAMIQALHQSGITIVVAAGNDSGREVQNSIPAAYPEVLSVASTTAEDGSNACRQYNGIIARDTASYFTTDGGSISVSAPGEQMEDISKGCQIKSNGILSLAIGGGTTRKSGTSMAAPHVAGVVALIYAEAQLSDPEAIRSAVTGGSVRVGEVPLDSPAGSYSFDGVREGVISACGSLSLCP